MRFFRTPQADDIDEEQRTGLGRVIDVAARQGDAHGDDARAIAVLTAGLLRHGADASPNLVVEALLYRAELTVRVGGRPDDDFAEVARLIAAHGLGPEVEAALARARASVEEG